MSKNKPVEKNSVDEAQARFVKEYMFDRDPMAAALRAGVPRINVKTFVSRWMADASVLQQIKKATDEIPIDEMITPQRIIAGFIDVAFNEQSPFSARNTALRELATITDLYPEKDKEPPGSNGVIVVPGNPEDITGWEQVAQVSQQRLKEDVRK